MSGVKLPELGRMLPRGVRHGSSIRQMEEACFQSLRWGLTQSLRLTARSFGVASLRNALRQALR